ncbi:hypothetical protein [Aquimarina litoralis]|uniref:hypothetical protein n=1 Tax=Aquimarina litoralis TaxID=584605 RepID=UPI001C58E4D9|nr:hypothetical protein [Aquimarina litoralis]MBW1298421.1 hypothetical protein [Aquimarina litoralis]
MSEHKYSIELPERLKDIIEDFVSSYQEMHVRLEMVNNNTSRKVRLTFEGTPEMKFNFVNSLNLRIKQRKT